MKAEEQQRAIARAVGWTCIHPFKRSEAEPERLEGYPPKSKTMVPIPDYTEDLNCCVEFERWMDGKIIDIRSLYLDRLAILVGIERDKFTRQWKILRTTAAQRCEAFLKTLGLWKEWE